MIRPKTKFTKSLREIASLLNLKPSSVEVQITGLTHDSRQVRVGDLYLALSGSRTHGAQFADSAIAQGARAILTDESGLEILGESDFPVLAVPDVRTVLGTLSAWFYDAPSTQMNLVGITGTNGKTTTAHLIDSVWRSNNRRTGLIGTIETRISDTSVASVRTTPEATDLQGLFATMLEQGCSDVVMEVSSHALSLGRVDGTRFNVAVFTNLTQDHLDFHENMNDYFKAKSTLFSKRLSNLAVINIDDEYGAALARDCDIPTQTYSASGRDADWSVDEIARGADGTGFSVNNSLHGSHRIQIPLIGDHNVANAIAAFIVLVQSGMKLDDGIAGLATVSGVPGRLERVNRGQAFTAIVDYAHTPDAVEHILATLRAHGTGRLIAVLGCGGDRDPGKRPLMGAAVASGSDIAFLTSDNPRSEDPYKIIAQMASGAHSVVGSDVRIEADRAAAISMAVDLAAPGDIVLIAGKGHEQGQEIMGDVKPFDDREVLAHAIDRRITADGFR
jgi:UDP-N-acetylmuramoyl-L-alanyl-D-glutamate--2,6-diaminopimelate ligase